VRRVGLPALLLMAALATSLAGCVPGPIQTPTYKLVYQDEFNGDTLDPRWATAPFGDSLGAIVHDGVLTIQSTAENDYHWAYLASTGPRLDDEPNYPLASAWQRGYFEARIKYTDSPWAWPAFWMFSMAKTEAWPGEDCSHLNAEWDIMENGVENGDGAHPASSWYFSVLHRNTGDGTDDGYCGTPDTVQTDSRQIAGTDLSDWHTWSGRWTSNELCTYLDGELLQCVDPYDSTAQPMHLVFSMQYLGTCDGCPARPAALRMQVDWVRVWQRS
jgi:hypothetical protein